MGLIMGEKREWLNNSNHTDLVLVQILIFSIDNNLSYFSARTYKLIEPATKTLYSGNNAQIECNSWTMTVWFRKNLKTPISFLKILSLSNVTKRDSGTYYCFGDYVNEARYFIDSVEVFVLGGKFYFCTININ